MQGNIGMTSIIPTAFTPLSTDRSGDASPTIERAANSILPVAWQQGDRVTISLDAYEKGKSTQEAEASAEGFWRSYFSMWTISNEPGKKREITMDGNDIEILEYKGGRLVKQTNGNFSASGVTLDTLIYDTSGDVTQSIHTTLSATGTAKGTMSEASMSRHIEWFKHGEVSRTMDDSMRLQSQYRGYGQIRDDIGGREPTMEELIAAAMEEQSDSLEDLTSAFTADYHNTSYAAEIAEYKGSRLSRRVSLQQNSDFVNMTNRTPEKQQGMEPHTTAAMYHDSTTHLSMTEYDQDGNLLRTSELTDRQKNSQEQGDGLQEQSVSVSWYNKGELVKSSSGHMTLHEAPDKELMKRTNLLQVLNTSHEEYATATPQTALELLSNDLERSTMEPDHFGRSFTESRFSNAFNAPGMIAQRGSGNAAYSLRWKTEFYADGYKVASQEDEESAVHNVRTTSGTFRTGGGLTENAIPSTLKRTSHTDRSYDHGRATDEASINVSEYVDASANGPDVVRTHIAGTEQHGFTTKTDHRSLDGGIADNDRDYNLASTGMGKELGYSLADMHVLFGRLNTRVL